MGFFGGEGVVCLFVNLLLFFIVLFVIVWGGLLLLLLVLGDAVVCFKTSVILELLAVSMTVVAGSHLISAKSSASPRYNW